MTSDDHPRIRISPGFAEAGVRVRLGCLSARVTVREDDPATKQAVSDLAVRLGEELAGTTVGELPVVAEVRQAFRALGKDPSRYRPSSEALLRRVAQGKGLFNVNNLVDTKHLVDSDIASHRLTNALRSLGNTLKYWASANVCESMSLADFVSPCVSRRISWPEPSPFLNSCGT